MPLALLSVIFLLWSHPQYEDTDPRSYPSPLRAQSPPRSRASETLQYLKEQPSASSRIDEQLKEVRAKQHVKFLEEKAGDDVKSYGGRPGGEKKDYATESKTKSKSRSQRRRQKNAKRSQSGADRTGQGKYSSSDGATKKRKDFSNS